MSPLPLVAGLAAAVAVLLLLRPLPIAAGARRTPWWPWLLPTGLALLMIGSAVPAALLVAGCGVTVGVRALLGRRRRRREAAHTSERVLECCDLLAAELLAGQSPALALRRSAEQWPELRPVAEAAGLGGDPAEALSELARRPGAGDLRLVAAAWTVAHRTGSGLADALERVGAAVRERRATARVVESELASARATARLVAALPLVMLVLGGGPGSGAWVFLLAHPAGLACLAAGLALGLLGLWWIERIADAVVVR